MPNKCVKCGKIHPDDAPYLLVKGCDICGSRFFFHIKEEDIEKAEREIAKLTPQEIEEIEKDIRDIISEKGEATIEEDETVILDVEAIRIIKPGKYRIDITKLFQQRPIVIRVGEGKYEIDLGSLATKFRKKK
ncbi:MAG: hypothetical protein J7K72_02060 [Candidatus Aenigmarchaeota archaeon]|nr:hypothetical protein [Candidatus Aenigmarchaeota archaeon]